jgi:hypothetical protein
MEGSGWSTKWRVSFGYITSTMNCSSSVRISHNHGWLQVHHKTSFDPIAHTS